LTFHWYAGVEPPLVGVAVNVTEVPVQTGLADGETATLTGEAGLTVMVKVLDVAGLPDLHVRLDAMITYTWSALTGTQE
jgi:hypothetical protein